MSLVVSFALLLLIFSLHLHPINDYLERKQLHSLKPILILFTCVFLHLYPVLIEWDFVDKIYGLTWPVSLSTKSLIFVFAFFVLWLNSLTLTKYSSADISLQSICAFSVLLLTTTLPSPLICALFLVLLIGACRLNERDKYHLLIFPVFVLILELYSFSRLGAFTHESTLISHEVYGSVPVSVAILALMVVSIFFLLDNQKIGKSRLVVMLVCFLNLFCHLSQGLNSTYFFQTIAFAVLIFWLAAVIWKGSVIPARYCHFQQLLYVTTAFVFAGHSVLNINDALPMVSLLVLVTAIARPNSKKNLDQSIFAFAGIMLELVILGLIVPMGVAGLVHPIKGALHVTIIFAFFIVFAQSSLRASTYFNLEINQKVLLDFKNKAQVALSSIYFSLLVALAYFTLLEMSLSKMYPLVLGLPLAIVSILSATNRHDILSRLTRSILTLQSPDFSRHVLNTIQFFVKPLGTFVKISILAFEQISGTFDILFSWLSLISYSSVKLSVRYKVEFLFIFVAIALTVVSRISL